MSKAYVFVENCLKPRIVVTFDQNSAQLPSSNAGWALREPIDTDTVTPDMGIVGVGNAAEIIQRVRENGPLVMGGDPDT